MRVGADRAGAQRRCAGTSKFVFIDDDGDDDDVVAVDVVLIKVLYW